MHSKSKIDLKDFCAPEEENSSFDVWGKIRAFISRVTGHTGIKVKASSAWVGVRGERRHFKSFSYASIFMPLLAAYRDEESLKAYKELETEPEELKNSVVAFYLDSVPGDYFYLKVDKGKVKVLIPGKPELIIGSGKEIYQSLYSPEFNSSKAKDIIVVPLR